MHYIIMVCVGIYFAIQAIRDPSNHIAWKVVAAIAVLVGVLRLMGV